MHEPELEVRQATIRLPLFNDIIPTPYMDDVVPRIPVILLCEMQELRIFCGIWTVCFTTGEDETSLHLLQERFLWHDGKRDHMPPRGEMPMRIS